MKRYHILHLTTHLNIGGITSYIYLLGGEMVRRSYRLSVLSSGGEMTSQFNQAGMTTYEFSIRTKSELSPKLYLALPKILRLIRAEKFDLIHAHTRVTQVLAWWIRYFTGIPFVSTCHGFYQCRLGRRLLPAWGNRVVAISPPVADALIKEFHVPAQEVITILNAIDSDGLIFRMKQKNASAIKAEWNLETGYPIVGIVSRVVEDKGHVYLLKAFTKLCGRYNGLKLVIVGEGPFLNRTKKLAQKLGLDQCVVFVGKLNDVTKALAVIDIFVLPAIWREGFGLSIVEAMALKKPVIATNIWALNALVHHRVNGLLIEPKNMDQLADAISELVEDEPFRREIGQRAYQTVMDEFSMTRMTSEMSHLYQSVLDGAKSKNAPACTSVR